MTDNTSLSRTGMPPSSPRDSGRTQPAQSEGNVGRLPHERDESTDSQPAAESTNRQQGEQAHADVTSGLVDTDRGPVTDQLYNDQVRTEKTPMRD